MLAYLLSVINEGKKKNRNEYFVMQALFLKQHLVTTIQAYTKRCICVAMLETTPWNSLIFILFFRGLFFALYNIWKTSISTGPITHLEM